MPNNEKNSPEALQQRMSAIERLLKRLPDIAGIEAVKLYKENFAKQGWQGTSFEPWQRKKTPNGYQTLRTDNQNSLMASIHIAEKTPTSVTIATADNKPYARIHNEGGTINVPVTPKMRKWAWAMFYKTKEDFYKGIALTKKTSLQITMPKRQFMGDTPELLKRIQIVINHHLNRL